ncbi:hypothetical protein D3C72_1383470 [compost metagenome]
MHVVAGDGQQAGRVVAGGGIRAGVGVQCLPEELPDMRRQPRPRHRVRRQRGQADFMQLRQRMRTAYEEPCLQRGQPLDLQVRQCRQAAAFADEDIEPLGFQRAQHGRRVGGLHVDAQARVAPHQRLQHLVQQERRRERPEAGANLADLHVLQQLQVAPQFAAFAQHAPRALQHQHAGRSGAHLAVATVDQLAEIGFERLDAARQRRLRQVQRAGGAGKAALFDQGDEVMQLSQAHRFNFLCMET